MILGHCPFMAHGARPEHHAQTPGSWGSGTSRLQAPGQLLKMQISWPLPRLVAESLGAVWESAFKRASWGSLSTFTLK